MPCDLWIVKANANFRGNCSLTAISLFCLGLKTENTWQAIYIKLLKTIMYHSHVICVFTFNKTRKQFIKSWYFCYRYISNFRHSVKSIDTCKTTKRGSCQLLMEGCWFTARNNVFLQLWKLNSIYNQKRLKKWSKTQIHLISLEKHWYTS